MQHLSTLPGAEVEVTLEIRIRVPDSMKERRRAIVTGNANTLKFASKASSGSEQGRHCLGRECVGAMPSLGCTKIRQWSCYPRHTDLRQTISLTGRPPTQAKHRPRSYHDPSPLDELSRHNPPSEPARNLPASRWPTWRSSSVSSR